MRRTPAARPPAEACARARPASNSPLAARPHTRRRSQRGPAWAHPLPRSQDHALPPAPLTAPLTASLTAPPACEGRAPSLCWRGGVARKSPRRPRAGWPPRARLRWSLPRRGALPQRAPEAPRAAASRPICGRTSRARWSTQSSARSVQSGSCLSCGRARLGCRRRSSRRSATWRMRHRWRRSGTRRRYGGARRSGGARRRALCPPLAPLRSLVLSPRTSYPLLAPAGETAAACSAARGSGALARRRDAARCRRDAPRYRGDAALCGGDALAQDAGRDGRSGAPVWQ